MLYWLSTVSLTLSVKNRRSWWIFCLLWCSTTNDVLLCMVCRYHGSFSRRANSFSELPLKLKAYQESLHVQTLGVFDLVCACDFLMRKSRFFFNHAKDQRWTIWCLHFPWDYQRNNGHWTVEGRTVGEVKNGIPLSCILFLIPWHATKGKATKILSRKVGKSNRELRRLVFSCVAGKHGLRQAAQRVLKCQCNTWSVTQCGICIFLFLFLAFSSMVSLRQAVQRASAENATWTQTELAVTLRHANRSNPKFAQQEIWSQQTLKTFC